MAVVFEELDYQETPLGVISLRRRSEPRLNNQILYEIKLDDEFLMSSLFTEAEIQLSKICLAALEGDELDVVVGGLGLGYTAKAALEHPKVRSLRVVDVMAPVIDWHRRGLVPLGSELMSDPRCTLIHADFFDVATSKTIDFDGQPYSQTTTQPQVHAVLLDIDHSPSYWLNPGNSAFYTEQGLKDLSEKILSGGIFGLWSDEPPAADFMLLLNRIFKSCESHIISFPNPYLGTESTNTVYLARKA